MTNLSFSKVKIAAGFPSPLGVNRKKQGLNFAVFSKNATRCYLSFFEEDKIVWEIPLDPQKNRSGNIWHIYLENLPKILEYGYRFEGPYNKREGHLFEKSAILSDPYSKYLSFSNKWGERKGKIKSRFLEEAPFAWEGVKKPHIPLQDLVIYEMHVRGFTRDPSANVKHKGTFLGIIEKIPYLKSLGINAIELLPIFEFDELATIENRDTTVYNYWGYSPINFFSIMKRYNTYDSTGFSEFKMLVKELHRNGIEIILDVVFNHSAEGNNQSYYLNFRGIDNKEYYLLDKDGNYLNFSGCGNTFNCNNPPLLNQIMDSLHFWVSEMQVDGFRFDLASILTRGKDGNVNTLSLLEEIEKSPLLSKTKLIAEPWDAAGLYQLGKFSRWGRWSEWNDFYRDKVRKFMKGDDDQVKHLADSICGSFNLYSSPLSSVNYITSHDGFTLKDLVSYNNKHNWENGENNRDGIDNNESWNCGIEGPTSDKKVIQLRERQIRNFYLVLMISQGIPMIQMGDEYGHSREGNNNSWCQDNRLNWFLWDELENNKHLFNYISFLINFRKKHKIFRKANFWEENELSWHGILPKRPSWKKHDKFLAFSTKDEEEEFYCAFNASPQAILITLPKLKGREKWEKVVDSSSEIINSPTILEEKYSLTSYSSLLAKKNH